MLCVSDVAYSDGKTGDYLFLGNFVYTVSEPSRLNFPSSINAFFKEACVDIHRGYLVLSISVYFFKLM